MTAGPVRREVVLASQGTSELWPRPVVVRPKEGLKKKRKWATELFGPPGEIGGFLGYEPGTPAQLQVLDLILLHAFFEQSMPAGERHIYDTECGACGRLNDPREQVRHARVVGALPRGAGESGPPERFIVAEVPLERDGSFQVAIPSGVAFDIQSLNADRMALRMPNRWLYSLPGEKHTLSIPRMLYTEVCSGCHGDLRGRRATSLGRPDAITSASRTAAVFDSATGHERRPPNLEGDARTIAPAPYGVGFEADIAPLLERRCARCHEGADPAAGLALRGPAAFDGLRRFVEHREALARKSRLMEIVMGRELDAPGRPLEGPHPADDPLEVEELRLLVRWIDLGAPRRRATLR